MMRSCKLRTADRFKLNLVDFMDEKFKYAYDELRGDYYEKYSWCGFHRSYTFIKKLW